MKKLLLAALAFGMFWSVAAATAVEGFVCKRELNVRAGAGTKYTLVGKLAKNNPVRIFAANQNWLEIAVPGNCGVWVMTQYVKNGKLTSNVNLRSGPGTGYEAVGGGKAGMAAKSIGKATASGWIMIEASESVHYYVSRPAIEAKKEELEKLPKISCKLALPDADWIALESAFTGAGKAVTQNGTISAFDSGNKAITCVLYVEKGDELVPAAYLVPGKVNVKPLLEKEVRITGTSHTIKGWDLPVIELKSIKAK